MTGRRECPGCGREIDRPMIACRECWRRVPGELRNRLAVAGRLGTHRDKLLAAGAVAQWLRGNLT